MISIISPRFLSETLFLFELCKIYRPSMLEMLVRNCRLLEVVDENLGKEWFTKYHFMSIAKRKFTENHQSNKDK